MVGNIQREYDPELGHVKRMQREAATERDCLGSTLVFLSFSLSFYPGLPASNMVLLVFRADFFLFSVVDCVWKTLTDIPRGVLS